MVGVAQLVEPRIVIPVVVGSSPIVHPSFPFPGWPGQDIWSIKDVDVRECGRARVAELVDALDLGSSGATRESSSLSFRTTFPVAFGSQPSGSETPG